MAGKALFWFRRDLRLKDNKALAMATQKYDKVYCVFIFDTNILDKIKDKNDQRISFIQEGLDELPNELLILTGDPHKLIPKLANELQVDEVYCNKDYDPYSIQRDKEVEKKLGNIFFQPYKDHVIFEKDEILTKSGTYFKVFTPYKNRWLEKLSEEPSSHKTFKSNIKTIISTGKKDQITHGFKKVSPIIPGGEIQAQKLKKSFLRKIADYNESRDFPYIEGTSNLSAHLRFGMISTRELVRLCLKDSSSGARVWLSELVWRDFYNMILSAFPYVATNAFKEKYQNMNWPGENKHFLAWCRGETGVPIVDAAMTELNETGRMPNRLRMIVASYLCKILLISWQKGENYFREKLFDYDMAANNGGWQWSSSTGCDATPYFRIFNPYTQSKKFDPNAEYILTWLPHLSKLNLKEIHNPVDTIVDYKSQRKRCLDLFKNLEGKSK